MRVDYHSEALAELTETTEFYERRLVGLSARFAQNLDEAIKAISAEPTHGRLDHRDVRIYGVKGFPYQICYRVLSETRIRILAVKHHKRHPDYWKHRLD
jgi:plasmid stabilization system protein ParE